MSRPVPLLQETGLDADLRAVLDAAADHEPSPTELAKLASRLSGVLPPGTMPPAPSSPPPQSPPPGNSLATGSLAGKLALAFALGGAIVGGIWLAERDASRPASAPVEERSQDRREASDAAAPLAVVLDAGWPVSGVLPAATPSTAPDGPGRQIPPKNAHQNGYQRGREPDTAPAQAEGKLLARAHEELLRGAANEALATTSEHAKAYPRGGLVQEREVIAIEALASLGRLDEARRRARAFRLAYPGSSHLGQIERVIADPVDGQTKE